MAVATKPTKTKTPAAVPVTPANQTAATRRAETKAWQNGIGNAALYYKTMSSPTRLQLLFTAETSPIFGTSSDISAMVKIGVLSGTTEGKITRYSLTDRGREFLGFTRTLIG